MPEIVHETPDQHIASLRRRCQDLQAEVIGLRAAQRPRAVEKYYSPAEVALLLGFSAAWVLRKVKDGELAGAIHLGQEIRIPASSINAFLDGHREPDWPVGVSARNAGELRRKSGQFQAKGEQS